MLADDPTDQTLNARVFATLRFLLRQRLAIGRPVTYVDATHLSVEERLPYITLGSAYGCDVEAVWFDVPAAVCQERNRGRTRVVPPGCHRTAGPKARAARLGGRIRKDLGRSRSGLIEPRWKIKGTIPLLISYNTWVGCGRFPL